MLADELALAGAGIAVVERRPYEMVESSRAGELPLTAEPTPAKGFRT